MRHSAQQRVEVVLLWLALGVSCGLYACAAGAARPSASSAPPSAAVVGTVPLGSFGTSIALLPNGSRALVAASGAVYVVDLAALQVAATIRTGATPYAVAVTPAGDRAVAFDLLQNQAWILDPGNASIVKHLWLGEPKTPVLRPGVAIARGARSAFLTISRPEGQGNDVLDTIDLVAGSDAAQRGLSFHPGAIATSPDGRLLHVAGCVGFCSSGVLHSIDPASPGAVAAPVQLPSVPGGIAVSPDGRRAWVANGDSASVSAIDLVARTVTANVPVGAEPLGVAVSPDGSRVYVTTFTAGTLVTIDAATNAVVGRTNVGATPRAIAISADGTRAYLTHSDPVLSVVDLARLGP